MGTARPLIEQLEHLRGIGRDTARERAAAADTFLRDVFAGASPQDGVALLALGGYGRGELAPASDIDLLILHDGQKRIREISEGLLYPLWDAGLAVGHAVRTPKECLSESAARLDVAAAMLDARCLAGDEQLASGMSARLLAWARDDARRFALKLREDSRLRHATYSSVTYHLEPDLKEGAGGLRDVNSLGWLAKAATGGRERGALVDAGLLRASELQALDEAEEFLFRERSALHLLTGRRTDRAYLEHQPALTEALGFKGEPALPAPDALMRATFERGRTIAHIVSSVFERYLEPGAGEVPDFAESPEGVMELFAAAAEGTVSLSPALLDRVEQVDVPPQGPWAPAARDAFLRILRSERAVPTLEAMDRSGFLGRFIPEWDWVRCRPQRDPYHRFTVDMHLLETLAEMQSLLAGRTKDPVAAEAAGVVRDRDAVLLGALFHDIGKTGGLGGHVSRGVEVAAPALGRMGLPDLTRQAALFLVEKHLLVSDTATRRDLTDESLILDVAATVGGQQHLACLFLLSVADAAATGPHAATPWRMALMRELVAKVQHVLERGEMGAETAEILAERTDAIREALRDEDPDDVERFVTKMPRAYLFAVSPEQAARHFSLVADVPGRLEVRTDARGGRRPGSYELTVVAADRPGFLFRVAGALSLAQLSILSAQVFTTEDGIAVDLFEVAGAFDDDVGEGRWREFRNNLRKALDGRLSLDYRVKEKRTYYPPPRRDIPIEVTVDNDASDFYTVIEVGCADRIGLLFDITRAFSELELDVHLAKVATYGGRVIDAFYVRDMLGRKILDPEHAAEIERAIISRLSG